MKSQFATSRWRKTEMCGQKSNMFLLGAGFTSIITGGKSPVMESLYDKIIGDIPLEIKERYEDLNEKKDIEKLLTLVELDIMTESSKADKLKVVRENVKNKILDVLDFDKIKPDNSDPVKAFIKILKKNDVILSLNYDIVLERFLWDNGNGIWSPDTGYTSSIRHDLYNPEAHNQNRCKSNIEVIKPHGSINFIEGYVDFEKSGYTDIMLEVDEKYFPKIYSHFGYIKELQVGRKILIPAYIKPEIFHQALANLWHQAFARVKNSKNLVIIGCGLRSADLFVWWLVYLFIRNKDKKIIILDKNAERIKGDVLKTLNILEKSIEGQVITLQEEVHSNFDMLKTYL